MTSSTPTHIAVILYPGFQLLDVAGPLDALNMLAQTHKLHLSLLAETMSPVTTRVVQQDTSGSEFAQHLVPTHTFADPPARIDAIIVPGGMGARDETIVQPVVEFLRRLGVEGGAESEWKRGLQYVLTVCTGSMILAETGALDGRKATTNKRAFNDVKARFPQAEWVAKARWVVDGAVWTSSGVSAGIDLTFAWMAKVWGEEVADFIADRSEYERNGDAKNDRFADRWGAV